MFKMIRFKDDLKTLKKLNQNKYFNFTIKGKALTKFRTWLSMTDKKTPLGKNQMIVNNARLFGKFITQKICTNMTANIKDINCK